MERVNVLLVDDQRNNLVALEAMLSDLEVNCVRAESGTQALKRLLDQDFAVILLDVQMPGLDGFETAHLIRQRDKSRHTPIIFVTALSRNESNIFQGYSVGAVDYLFKPIVPEILRSKVQVFVDLFRKNRALERQAAELARLSRQNELILNSAADGVIGVDLSGKVTFANPAAARLLGHAPDWIVGHALHGLLHRPEDGGGVSPDCRLEAALRGEPAFDPHDDSFWRGDGSVFPSEYSATPMQDEEGELIGTVLTFRDVTERRAAAAARENERLYHEAQAASQAKDDFLATLSHELRTPMTAIIGWNEILGMGGLDDATRDEALAAIRSSARAQSRLIDDMLDVSRIIMGKFDVDLRPVHIASIVDSAVEMVRHSAESRGIRIQAELGTGDSLVMADHHRMRQVIWNLLSNAIKFSPDEGTVEVSLHRADGIVRIEVVDHGEGIDASMLPHIFDRLVQTADGKTKGGLGLGLAIARHIVELHGGTIEATSGDPGSGARFAVSLPVSEPEPEGVHSGERISEANQTRG